MSTVMKNHTGPMVPPPAKKPQEDVQLQRDRRTAAIVLALMIALMAFILWLASMGEPIEYNDIDYWHMMP